MKSKIVFFTTPLINFPKFCPGPKKDGRNFFSLTILSPSWFPLRSRISRLPSLGFATSKGRGWQRIIVGIAEAEVLAMLVAAPTKENRHITVIMGGGIPEI